MFTYSTGRCVVLLVFVASVLFHNGCQPRTDKTAAKEIVVGESSSAKPSPSIDREKLRGRWLRQDGGYILAVGEIDSEGRAQASYFNPSPVKVAWSRIVSRDSGMSLLVELRDTNYPGCLYTLNYDSHLDRLTGTYFQAQLQETYQVEFARER